MKNKKILITGASGLLGRSIYTALKTEKIWKVVGTAFSRDSDDLIKVDLSDIDNLDAFLNSIKPDIIIHSAAERRPDVSMQDPEGARHLNVDVTAAIANWAAANEVYLIYISTDYVFDGTEPPYQVDSLPNPLNDYGLSKRAGEKAVLSTCSNSAILRIPILYGDVEYLEESAVIILTCDLLNAAEGESVKMENWATRHPTLTDDVADVIRQMLVYAEDHPTLKGIFHWSSDEAMTKYEMACIMADVIGFSRERIIADNNPPGGAPRPKDCTLDTSLLRNKGIEKQTPFRKAIPLILHEHVCDAAHRG